jgi:aspartyl-tRNA(Asn)/glutamyl-tRNA(Gln) amidotransferase subunit B
VATEYEPVIGLEIHAQLATESKLFCGCATDFGGAPNSNVCPVCLGLPGTLPAINEKAVRFGVRAALALGCSINPKSIFARKNYFYPDLPKGYQISQYELPFSEHGKLEVEFEGAPFSAGITRVHLEEDAGKNVHGVQGASAIDLNRAGTPLIEIVGDPDLRSSEQAAAYMRAVRDILMAIGVNDGNMEEGSLRCDANVSIRPRGSDRLGTRVELKNLNSFKFVQRAIDVEIARQTAILDGGRQVAQETRSFDPTTSKTATLRSKEEAHDYRYFPDPDLPALEIDEKLIETERSLVGELPEVRRQRYVGKLSLSRAQATTLCQHPGTVAFFEQVLTRFGDPVKAANFVLTEVLRGAKFHGLSAEFTVSAGAVAELLDLVETGKISGKQAKEVFALLEADPSKSPQAIVQERGLEVVSDAGALESLIRELMQNNPKQVASIRAGKTNVVGFFVGQVMKATGGSADPKLVSELLTRLLATSE